MSNDFKPIDLDASLDDIDDLPGFGVFPSGAHIVIIESASPKKIGDHPAVEISMKLVSTDELSEPLAEGEAEPKAGDVQSIAFMLDNEFGAGKLKEFLKPIAEHTGHKKLSELITALKGMTLIIIQKKRADKNDKDKFYPDIKKIAVV